MADRTFEVNITTAVQAPYAIKNAGYAGEHNATAIQINLPAEYIGGFTYSLDVKTGAGEAYNYPLALGDGDDFLLFELPHPLTDKGALDLTLKITETATSMVVKSRVINLQIIGRDISVYAELAEDYVPDTTATEDCLNAAALANLKAGLVEEVIADAEEVIANTGLATIAMQETVGAAVSQAEEDIAGAISQAEIDIDNMTNQAESDIDDAIILVDTALEEVDTVKAAVFVDKGYGEMYSYDNATAAGIYTANVYHAIFDGFGNNDANLAPNIDTNLFTYKAGVYAEIASVANYNSPTNTKIELTLTAPHTFLAGEPITIQGTTNYNGVYIVQAEGLTSTKLVVLKTYVSTQTGSVLRGASLKVTYAGKYNLSFNVSGSCETNDDVFKFELYKDATPLDNICARAIWTTGTNYRSASASGIATLTAGQYIWLATKNYSGTGDLTIRSSNVSILKLTDNTVDGSTLTIVEAIADAQDATTAAEAITAEAEALVDTLDSFVSEIPSTNLINEDLCIPFPTAEATDNISAYIPMTVGEYYCLTEGTAAMRTYLILYLYDESKILVGSFHYGDSDALWSANKKTVNFTDPTEIRTGYGFQCPSGVAFCKVRWTHSRTNRTLSAFSDGGSGTVIVTAANHALLLAAGTASIAITNSTDYNGTHTATYINTNSFSIPATYTQTRTGKGARYNFLASLPMLHVSPDGATYTFLRWVTGVPELLLDEELIAAYRAEDLATVQENLEARTGLRVYVSPTGSDSNDGLTPETPYLTFAKAETQNPSEVYAFRGLYQHTVSSSFAFHDLPSLKILPYDNDETYAHENPDRQMITIDNGVDLDSLTLVDGLYEQTFASNTFLNHVFVAQDQAPGSAGGYNANCWQHSDVEADNKALKPVLSKILCLGEAGTFFYDGTKIYINPYATAYTGFSVPNSTAAASFADIQDLTIFDVEFKHQHYSNVTLQNIGNINMQNCAGKYACQNDAFDIDNVNGQFIKCYATRSGNDGFNIHNYGNTTFIDCKSTYNLDDGVSHHDGCVGTFFGGEYSYNGKGGIVPAYGAQVNIYDAFCSGNADFGIGYLTTTNGHAAMTGRVGNCLMVGNTNWGLRVDALATVIAYGNLYSGNGGTAGVFGSLTSY